MKESEFRLPRELRGRSARLLVSHWRQAAEACDGEARRLGGGTELVEALFSLSQRVAAIVLRECANALEEELGAREERPS